MADRNRSSAGSASRSTARKSTPRKATASKSTAPKSSAGSISQVARHALAELEQLVGCPAEGVVGARKDDDGWVVEVEVLELSRIPETTDVLAGYEVTVDTDGDVTGYRRVRRYLRAQVED